MLVWTNPITDRTKNDVDRVKELRLKGWQAMTEEEKEEWLAGIKGAINITDLQRVQDNISIIADVLELDLDVSDVPLFPTEAFMQEIIDNVEEIRKAYMVHADTPATPSAPLNSWQKWNDIEKILDDVYGILLNNFYYYCGNEIYCGDNTGLLL